MVLRFYRKQAYVDLSKWADSKEKQPPGLKNDFRLPNVTKQIHYSIINYRTVQRSEIVGKMIGLKQKVTLWFKD